MVTGEVIAVAGVDYADLPAPLVFRDDSSFQNLSEFVGIVLGMLILRSLGYAHLGVHLKGDSTSALSWAESERFRSMLTKPSAMVYLGLCVDHGFEVVSTEYVPSVLLPYFYHLPIHKTLMAGWNRSMEFSALDKMTPGICG
jgi:hypothetical protein